MKRALLAAAGLSLLAGCSDSVGVVRSASTGTFGNASAGRAYEDGKAKLADGHPGLAIVAFENAIANDPRSVAALNGVGAAYDELHRYDLAQSYYRRALDLEPKSADVVYNMAISRRLSGSSDAARWFAKASALAPDNALMVADAASATPGPALARQQLAESVPLDRGEMERPQPLIQRASVIEYELVLPPQRPIDLGKAAGGPAPNVVPVRPRMAVPPIDAAAGKSAPREPAKVTSFDPTLVACAPNVAPATLNAIIHTESGGNPLALHVNGSNEQPPPARNAAEAANIAASYVERGYSVDVGLMQVNTRNLASTGHTLQQAFDPCTNILHGSSILTASYTSATHARDNEADALVAALSAYNTGDFRRGITNGYVAHVMSVNTNAGPRLPRAPAIVSPEITVKPQAKRHNTDADMARLTLAIDLIEQRIITAQTQGEQEATDRFAMR